MNVSGGPRISVRVWVIALAAALGATSLLALAGALARGEGAWWPLASLGIGGAIAVAAWRAAVAAEAGDGGELEDPIPLHPDGPAAAEDAAEVDGTGVRKAA